jgi:hypothetical protein
MRNDLHEKLGRLTATWSTLDAMLRLALKRLEGLSIKFPKNPDEEDRIEVIFGRLTHGPLVEQLEKAIARKPIAGLKPLIDAIGRDSSGTGLYARRNDAIHALWVKTRDGKSFQQRIGNKKWRKPLRMTGTTIENLIDEIQKTQKEIDRLTKPLLSERDELDE